MRILTGIGFSVLLATLWACDSGQNKPQDNKPTATAVPEEPEVPLAPAKLWLTPPDGWTQIHQQADADSRQVRYQHADELDHFLSVESRDHPSADAVVDPLRQMDDLEADSQAQCPNLQSFATFTGEERGFPTVVRLLVCPPSEGKDGRINLVKLMGSERTNYVVAFEKSWAPYADVDDAGEDASFAQAEQDPAVAVWSLYLRNVYLCRDDCQQLPAS